MRLLFWLLVCGIFVFSGCNIINPDETIPAYLHIDTVFLKENGTGNEKSLTHNISDVWVYVNDQNIGAYELPATIPVLKDGDAELRVAAGIKISGLSGFRLDYPFMDFYLNDTAFSLEQEKITTITPEFKYYDQIDFKWIEDFENSSLSIDTTWRSEVGINVIEDDVKSGIFAGEIILSKTDSTNYFEAYSQYAYILPKGEKPVFLEMDYKIEESLAVGLKAYNIDGTTSENTIIVIEPKLSETGEAVWNKIYVELTYEVSAYYNLNAVSYQIAFSSITSKPHAKLLIDNLKLLTSE